MKTFSVGLTAAYASGGSTICACLRVLRTDGVVENFTATDQDLTIGGESYDSATGLDITNLVVQSSLAVDNMEMHVFPDETGYPQADILAGRWDNARFWLFECDYTDAGLAAGSPVGAGLTDSPSSAERTDINLLKRGTTGEADTLRSTRRFEFRGIKQALQQPVGAVTSKTCRYRLGDSKCRVDLGTSIGSPSEALTNIYPTTAVASRRVFTCAAATEVSDFYGEGTAEGVAGANAGYRRKIKSFAAGLFTLALEMPFPVGVGDTFEFVAGCRKRLLEDCKAKFDNVLNFGGEPHLPGVDLITADPEIAT
ncbi:MAG: DUF2163 domain-containing protein [Planctomycetota bacterium]